MIHKKKIHKKKIRSRINDLATGDCFTTWCGETASLDMITDRWGKATCLDCFMGHAKTKQPVKVRYTRSTQLYRKGVKKI